MGYSGYGFNPAQANYGSTQVTQGYGARRGHGPRPGYDTQQGGGFQSPIEQFGRDGFRARRFGGSMQAGGQFDAGRGAWGRHGGSEAMRGVDHFRAHGQTSTQRADDLMGRADANGDGQLTRDELVAAFEQLRAAATATTTAATTTAATTTDVAGSATSDVDTASTDATVTTDTTTTAVDSATADVTTTDTAVTDATTLADLLATTDTSSTEVPVAPATDDTTASSVV